MNHDVEDRPTTRPEPSHDSGRYGQSPAASPGANDADASRQSRRRDALIAGGSIVCLGAILAVAVWHRGSPTSRVSTVGAGTAGQAAPTVLESAPPTNEPAPTTPPAPLPAPKPAERVGLMAPLGVGSLLAVRANGALVEIDEATHGETVRGSLPFRPDTSYLALGADRQTVFVGRSGADERRIDVVRVSPGGTQTTLATDATAFALSPDGRRLAVAYPGAQDGRGKSAAVATIVETELGAGAERAWSHPGFALENITRLAYAPDGRQLAYVAVFENPNVRVFALSDEPSEEPLPVPGFPSRSVGAVAWSADDRLVISSDCCYPESEPSSVITIDLSGQALSQLDLDISRPSLAVSAGGWTAIVGPTLALVAGSDRYDFGPYLAATF